MNGSREPLGRHVELVLDEARLERQRAGIAARVQLREARPPTLRRALIGLSGAGLALLAIGAIAAHHERPAPAASAAGTVIETAVGGETITLPDGSRAELETQSRLELAEARADSIRLELERGGVTLDVVPSARRPFVVVARGYEARVLGTRFAVRLRDDGAASASIEVEVKRGKVRITHAGEDSDLRTLAAGERWSARLGGAEVAAAEATPAPAAKPLVEPREAQPEVTARVGAKAPEELRERPAEATATAVGPRELLAKAEAARVANRPRESARLLEVLRTRHRHDPRAALAAFELGRLRADRLDDPRGAAEAFADAITLAPDAPFREDAQARLVEAREAEGDRPGCAAARADYLARYPAGVHRPKVAARCPP